MLLQDLEANPLLSPMMAGGDQIIARLEAQGHMHRKLVMLSRAREQFMTEVKARSTRTSPLRTVERFRFLLDLCRGVA